MAILPVVKCKGETPYETLQRNVPSGTLATYIGRLDPLADGVMLLATDEDRYNKALYQHLKKTYRATFLLGYASDTGDVLGIARRGASPDITTSTETCLMEGLRGRHLLSLPRYAGYKVQGDPLHVWARRGEALPYGIARVMEVESVFDVVYERRSQALVYDEILSSISLVRGDFRQRESIKTWESMMDYSSNAEDVVMITCSLLVTSGTFIRALAEVVGDIFSTEAVVFSLTRTRMGEFSL